MFPINDKTVTRMLRRKLNSANIKLLDWEIVTTKAGELQFSMNSAVLNFVVHYQFKGEEYTEGFFAKVPICSDTYERNCKLGFLENELMAYENVVPYLNRVSDHSFTPVLYYSSQKDYTLIMSDLKLIGYSSNFDEQFGLEESLRVLQELAKFHAASVKVLQIRADVFDWLNTTFINKSPLFSEASSRQMIGNRFKKLFLQVDAGFWRQNADRLENYQSHLFELHVAERLSQENPLNVLNHGDCWKTNIMLKYRQEVIESVKFVDFQACMVGSPAIDVFFFIMTSIEFEVFEENGDKLLETYVGALNEWLQEFDCGVAYSKDQLQKDIDGLSSFWMFVLLFWMPVIFSNIEEIREKTASFDGLLDSAAFAPICDKWMRYFVRRSQEYPELKIFCHPHFTKS